MMGLKKQIQTIKQNNEESDAKGNMGVDFIQMMEEALKETETKEKRIKAKLKKYKRYKFE